LPTDRLATDRLATDTPRQPLVVVGHKSNRQVLLAVDQVAEARGLAAGMSLTHARAMVPDLVACPADPAGDGAALEQLAAWCLRYTPLVAPAPPDGIWIDVTGCTHLFGGERRLLRDLLDRLGDQGLEARVGIADTPGAAWAAARFLASRQDPMAIIPPEAQAAVLAPLPIDALCLPADTVDDLRLLGFETMADLAAVPRAPLVRRLGARVVTRLDQVLGAVAEPITPVVPPDLIQARETFEEPLLDAEPLAAAIDRLTQSVCLALERCGKGAHRLDLLFGRVDSVTLTIRVTTVRPSRDARHLGRMLQERLTRIDPALGVETMCLVATRADALAPTTGALMDGDQAGRPTAELMDRLMNRFADHAVYSLLPIETPIPERSARRVPPHLSPASAALLKGPPRPVRFLVEPSPIQAMALLPDNPPVAFTWRRVRHRIRRAEGPERIAGEWWKREGEMFSIRDYYRVEDESGRRFWLFRRGDGSAAETGDGCWFLHGFF